MSNPVPGCGMHLAPPNSAAVIENCTVHDLVQHSSGRLQFALQLGDVPPGVTIQNNPPVGVLAEGTPVSPGYGANGESLLHPHRSPSRVILQEVADGDPLSFWPAPHQPPAPPDAVTPSLSQLAEAAYESVEPAPYGFTAPAAAPGAQQAAQFDDTADNFMEAYHRIWLVRREVDQLLDDHVFPLIPIPLTDRLKDSIRREAHSNKAYYNRLVASIAVRDELESPEPEKPRMRGITLTD